MAKTKRAASAPNPQDPLALRELTKVEIVLATLKAQAVAFYETVLKPALDWRTILLVAVAAALFYAANDVPVLKSYLLSAGLTVAALAFLHWYRKAQHPYLDLAVFAAQAQKDPLASSIVIVAVLGFMAVVLLFVLLAAIR